MSGLNLTLSPEALKSVSELALAHVGDAVFELLVRQELCCVKAAPMRDPLLTPEELTVYKRGRNAHTHQAPKSASPGQYARATGLEALFGWLWLTGQIDRIAVLFAAGKEDADAT